MKITEISFSKKMPYAPYLNLQPGFVATLDDGEDVLEAMKKLDDMATEYYNKNYSQIQNNSSLYSSEQQIENYKSPAWDTLEPGYVTDTHVGDIIQQSENQNITPSQKIINQIQQCSDITVLKSFELLAKNNEEIRKVYDIKMKEFI